MTRPDRETVVAWACVLIGLLALAFLPEILAPVHAFMVGGRP